MIGPYGEDSTSIGRVVSRIVWGVDKSFSIVPFQNWRGCIEMILDGCIWNNCSQTKKASWCCTLCRVGAVQLPVVNASIYKLHVDYLSSSNDRKRSPKCHFLVISSGFHHTII
jgi:hypothetical protein